MENNQNEEIRWQIEEIENQIEQMQTIRVKNGGGRTIMFNREEFYQMMYDKIVWKWKDFAKDLVIIMSVLTNIGLMLKSFGIL